MCMTAVAERPPEHLTLDGLTMGRLAVVGDTVEIFWHGEVTEATVTDVSYWFDPIALADYFYELRTANGGEVIATHDGLTELAGDV